MTSLGEEWLGIKALALAYGVDPCFILAIKIVESDKESKTDVVDMTKCVTSISHLLCEFRWNPFERLVTDNGSSRVIYGKPFISYVARHYAPIGNDFSEVNASWVQHVLRAYLRLSVKGIEYGRESVREEKVAKS